MSSIPSAPSQVTGPSASPELSGSRSNDHVASKSNGFPMQAEAAHETSSSESSVSRKGDYPTGFLRPRDCLDNGSSADDDDAYLTQSSYNTSDNGLAPPPLEDRIRQSMITSAGSHEKFLPICDLEKIITAANIRDELKRSGRLKSDPDAIARQVLQPPPGKDTSRRRIFAILCLLQKAPKIQAFIDGGYFDCDLPFDFRGQESSGLNEGFNPAPNLFKSWKAKNIDSFEQYQGQLSAPYFTLSNDNRLCFSEQKLHHSTILPFVEYEVKDRALGKTIQGGFSEVRIVKIHRAHHDYLSSNKSMDDIYFAVKQLQKTDDTSSTRNQDRVQEVQAYKRLNHVQHPHLTRLLATYTHRKHLHLIFPYATGDLHNFWYDHYPGPTAPVRDHKFVRWMSGQLLGLAQALHKIHHCDVHNFVVAHHASIDAAKTHGRHGDLKPENILWFRHESDGSGDDSFGVLKISDFGFAEFHSPISLSVETSGVGGITPTYKAPEFDMNRISPKYDIWSFGCILLQFVVWYLNGWEGVENFSNRRMNESNRLDHPDDFFNFYVSDEQLLVTEAKPALRQEFRLVRAHPASSDFILDLVDFIESKLLRMSAEKRTTCDEAKKKLEELDQLCRRSEEYCTQKRRTLTKTATDLSDRVEVNLSAKMRREIFETIDPASPKLPQVEDEHESDDSTPNKVATGTNGPSEQPSQHGTNPGSRSAAPTYFQSGSTIGLGIRGTSSRPPHATRTSPLRNTPSNIAQQVSLDDKDTSTEGPESIEETSSRRKRFRSWYRKLPLCFSHHA
ncbi:Nn.00g032080.m01.CDS01 [Neocucurbitaria sp. VM-36]